MEMGGVGRHPHAVRGHEYTWWEHGRRHLGALARRTNVGVRRGKELLDVRSVSKGCPSEELDLLLQDTILQLLELLELELLRKLFLELLGRNGEGRMCILSVWSHIEQQLKVVEADSSRSRRAKLAKEGGISGVLWLRLLATTGELLLVALLIAANCVAGIEHIPKFDIS
jgi:hypothetical protein